MFAPTQATILRIRGSAAWRLASAISRISLTSANSRSSAARFAARPAPLDAAVALAMRSSNSSSDRSGAPSAVSVPSSSPAVSKTAASGSPPAVIRSRSASSVWDRFSDSRASFSARSTLLRWTASVPANASIDDSRRFCKPPMTSAPAACLDRVSSLSRFSRSRRYACSFSASTRSGASVGRPSISICTTARRGKPPSSARTSDLRRRTMISSSCPLRTRTPRQKRCGSRISSSAEKLLEWPLCGVADRNRRCSKRGAMSRTARVIWESIA